MTKLPQQDSWRVQLDEAQQHRNHHEAQVDQQTAQKLQPLTRPNLETMTTPADYNMYLPNTSPNTSEL